MGKGAFDRWLSRSANTATFWPLLTGGAVGVVAGYLSRGVAAINAYGPFGWLMAGLVAFLIAALATYAGALAFDRFSAALARRKWARDVQDINPLEPEFTRCRIRISDLGHPLNKEITRKRFTECQLVGPAALISMGSVFHGVNFLNCDIVVVRDNVIVYNPYILRECTFAGGEIVGSIIYVRADDYQHFKQMGALAITYEGPTDGVAEAV